MHDAWCVIPLAMQDDVACGFPDRPPWRGFGRWLARICALGSGDPPWCSRISRCAALVLLPHCRQPLSKLSQELSAALGVFHGQNSPPTNIGSALHQDTSCSSPAFASPTNIVLRSMRRCLHAAVHRAQLTDRSTLSLRCEIRQRRHAYAVFMISA